jgi:hypothetical protein
MSKRILEKCTDGFMVGTLHGTVAPGIHPFEKTVGCEKAGEVFCSHLRQDPKAVADTLKRISEGMCLLAEKYIEMGMDAVYYAALGGEEYYFTDEEFEKIYSALGQDDPKGCQRRLRIHIFAYVQGQAEPGEACLIQRSGGCGQLGRLRR